MKKTLLLLSILTFFSCSEDYGEIDSEFNVVKFGAVDTSPPDCSQNFITPGIVAENQCVQGYSTRYQYSVYATAQHHDIVGYDRKVEIAVVKKNGGKYYIYSPVIVTIPANSHISNNALILTDASSDFGQISLIIGSVKKANGTLLDCYLPRTIKPSIANCFFDESALVDELRRHSTGIRFGGDDDFDNDGVPNDWDWDDDNDGTDDDYDPDDDNDGTPDNLDNDDDNDGIPDSEDDN